VKLLYQSYFPRKRKFGVILALSMKTKGQSKLINFFASYDFLIVTAKNGNTTDFHAQLKNKLPEEYAPTKMKASKP